MKTLGFKDVELRETFKLLAALLQIGNFEFEEAMIDNLDACHLIYNSGVKLGCPHANSYHFFVKTSYILDGWKITLLR